MQLSPSFEGHRRGRRGPVGCAAEAPRGEGCARGAGRASGGDGLFGSRLRILGRERGRRGDPAVPAARAQPRNPCADCVAGRPAADLPAPRRRPVVPPRRVSPSHDGRPVCPVQMGAATVACQGDSLRSVVPACERCGVASRVSVGTDLGDPGAKKRASGRPSSSPASWGFWSGAPEVALPEVSFFHS